MQRSETCVARRTVRDLRPTAIALMIALTLFGSVIATLAPAHAQTGSVDLALSGTDPSGHLPTGTTFTYWYTVANRGTADSTGSRFTAYIDPALVYVSASGAICEHDDSLVICSVGSIPSGTVRAIEITVTAIHEGVAFVGAGISARGDETGSNDIWIEDTDVGPEPTTPPSTVTLEPVADAHVKASSPTKNLGTLPDMEVDAVSVKVALLGFDLSAYPGRQVTAATLRLRATDSSPVGGTVHVSDGTPWSENTVTYATKPGWGAGGVDIGRVSAGKDYAIDVTSLVAAGRDVTLVITSPDRNGADYSSKEGTVAPTLDVTVAGMETTPPLRESKSTTLTPIADTWVEAGSAAPHGDDPVTQVDASPEQHIYMTFDLSSIPGDVMGATLRLHATDPSPHGGVISVTSAEWSEDELTYATRPETGIEVGRLGAVAAGSWYEIELSSLPDDADLLGLVITSSSTNGADYSSREGADPPQLVVRYLEPAL